MSGAILLWLILPLFSLAGWFAVVAYGVRERFGGTGFVVTATAAAAALVFGAAVALNFGGPLAPAAIALGMAALGAGCAVLWPLVGRLSGLAAAFGPALVVLWSR